MTDEEAAYDAWFRAAVRAACDDPRPSTPHEVVEAEFKARREALRRRLKAKQEKHDTRSK